MTAANFPTPILDFALREEGGFSDDPRDPGGATMAGITIATFRKLMGDPSLTIDDLKAITPGEEASIYAKGYWSVVRGPDLPSGVDLSVFDFGVNAGPGRSERLLQEAVGVAADGVLGPISMAAIAKNLPSAIITTLAKLQMVHYQSLPDFPTFGSDWTARTARRTKAALAMAAAALGGVTG